MRNLPTTYDPKDVEERLYTQWESRGYFHAEPDLRPRSLLRL